MDPAPESLPDDVAALKAALIAERARRLEVAAELAVAQAKASEDMALIAAQKLRIAKLERQVYGQRSERSARLIDQLALEFEEVAATATKTNWRRNRRPRRRRRCAPSLAAAPSATRSPTTCRASGW
jgi:transposase